MGRPYLIRSDFPIPENIPVFYFEVRIESEGKDGYDYLYISNNYFFLLKIY